MDNNKKNYIITIIIIVIIFTGIYFLLKYVTRNKNEELVYLRNYSVNEYIPSYVSDEAMAKIYLNDYINTMLYNTEAAYYLVDEDYRNARFGSYNAYYDYVINLGNYNIQMNKFYKEYVNGYLVFGIFDQNDNLYIFKTNGVLQYSVYLDDYTVEIR